MMTIPKKLQKGDVVRVIAPSLSMGIISDETRAYAMHVFEEQLGLRVSFGNHVEEIDADSSSPVASRIADLHEAFRDPEVRGIFTVIGGSSSNQLLDHIDWELIKCNPKVFCGFSDITALHLAIGAQTGMATYYGPHYSTFGQKHLDAFTVDYLQKCLFSTNPYDVSSADTWSDDKWFLDQENRHPQTSDGPWIIQPGIAEGTITGGNLFTATRLLNTKFMPQIENALLFIEDDADATLASFMRDLDALLESHRLTGFSGIVIGRFQQASKISRQDLSSALLSRPGFDRIPIVANVDFGHTDPKITFPIGGTAQIKLTEKAQIKIQSH